MIITIRLQKWIDYIAAVTLVSFFAIPTLRAAVGMPQAVYFLSIVALISLSTINLVLRRRPVPSPPMQAFMCLSLVLFTCVLFSGFWSPSVVDHSQDVYLVIALSLIVFSAPFVLNERVIRLFVWLLVCAGVGVATFVYHSYSVAGGLIGPDGETHDFYLTISQLLGASAVGLTLYSFTATRWHWWMIAVPYLLGGLALSLARGSLLAVLMIILTAGLHISLRKPVMRFSLASYIKSNLKRVGGLVAIAGIVIGVAATAMTVERTAARLLRMFDGGGAPLDTRGAIWSRAWESIQEAPILGHGLGSSGLMSGGTYPHNMFLQIWLDAGVFPLVIVCSLLGTPIIALVMHRKNMISDNKIWIPCIGIYLFMIMEYSKSYDFYTSRVLFISGLIFVSSVFLFPCSEDGSKKIKLTSQ